MLQLKGIYLYLRKKTMLSEDLILSILFGLASILYYRIHKWWISGRDKNPIFLKLETNTKSVENWVIIFFLAITSIGFLIKSII
jgi:hypothetical protein